MNKTKNQYKKLFAYGKKLWREGRLQESAGAYLKAAKNTTSVPEKARAYEMAGAMFFFARDYDSQRTNILKAAKFWLEIAEEALKTNEKIDAYWQAFSQFVAIRDTISQAKCITKITETVKKIKWKSIQWRTLKKLAGKFPSAASKESLQCLKSGLARIRVEQAYSEMSFEKKVKLLKEGLGLYNRAGDSKNEQSTLRLLKEIHHGRGAKIEKAVKSYKGFEDKARTYEAAATAYSHYCSEERNRCLKLAVEMHTKAAQEAETTLGFSTALADFEHSLNEKASKTYGTAPRTAEPLGISSYEKYVIVRSWHLGDIPHMDAHNEFLRFFADHCGIDIADPTARDLFSKLINTLGETTSYCPTPTATPQWIVTTKFKKIMLALIAGTLVGAIPGVAAGGMDPKAILIGVIGAHAAIMVNLISKYILTPENHKKTVSGLLKKYIEEPAKVFVILELKKRPQAIRELCQASGYSKSKMSRIIMKLKKDSTIQKRRSTTKPVLWELTHLLDYDK